MRPRRIWAIAWRDLRRVNAGRGWYRLPLLALGLLLPVGAIPLPRSAQVAKVEAVAAGEIPLGLRDRVRADPSAQARLSGEGPVVVFAAPLSPALRAALDSLPGPQVLRRRLPWPLPLPGRSLAVALLAISLLTGPLAESLPGERSARTLDVLLSAGVSRAEIVVGKALAWTLFGSVAAGLAALGGLWSGAQAPGLWPLALPALVGCAVALGLWLVRRTPDVVGGAAVPMRVLPAVALAMGGLAWGLARTDPLLGAAVPLGGALLVVSGVLTGPGALGAGWLGSGAAAVAMLWATARALDRGDAESAGGGDRGLALVGVATGLWMLAVAGPGVWSLAGNPNLVLPQGANLAAGGVLLAVLAGVVSARDGVVPGPWRSGWIVGFGAGLALGAVLGQVGDLLQIHPPGAWAPVTDRLAANAFTAGVGPGLAVVLGQTLLYWGVLPRRTGWVGAVLAWVLVASPHDPAMGLVTGVVLAWLARGWGLGAAMVALGVELAIRC